MKRYNNCFHGIIGQERIVEGLTQAIINNSIFHSYIFSGPKGSQRTRMAYSFARALLSKDKPSYNDYRIDDNNHPDLINIFPQGASIKIKQIREDIIGDILIKPFESNYKIYIIHDAHTMGVPAQNTLLKTLEEAPSYGVIILITDNLSALLPTIISRSQNYKFQPLKEEVIENYLQRHQGLELSKAREISLMANGSIERAIQLSQGEDIRQERQDLLEKLLRIIKDKDIVSVFSTGEYLMEQRDRLEELLDFLMLWFRDISVYKELGDNKWIIHKEDKKLLEEFSYYLSDKQINDIINDISIMKSNRRFNINLQLNIETMLLRIQEE
ncbi:MAG TPA: hypothetical protein GXZ78_03295 [Eubacteriaceae bacterium]|nr:hypothetical protein [Eubacteriaceae bacterium]